MLEDLEYVNEVACLLDREGNDCGLTLDKDRNLCLGPSFGLVEFSYPVSREALVAELFETFALERPAMPTGHPGCWT